MGKIGIWQTIRLFFFFTVFPTGQNDIFFTFELNVLTNHSISNEMISPFVLFVTRKAEISLQNSLANCLTGLEFISFCSFPRSVISAECHVDQRGTGCYFRSCFSVDQMTMMSYLYLNH